MERLNNPFKWQVDTYLLSKPLEDNPVYEEWRRNYVNAFMNSQAWEQGYSAATIDGGVK